MNCGLGCFPAAATNLDKDSLCRYGMAMLKIRRRLYTEMPLLLGGSLAQKYVKHLDHYVLTSGTVHRKINNMILPTHRE